MFKVFSKGFNELFGGFVVIFGAIGLFIGSICLVIKIVKFLESIIGTTWALILMCVFMAIAICIGNGLTQYDSLQES